MLLIALSPQGAPPRLRARAGMALFVFALLIEPFLGLIGSRSWTSIEVFGIAPDPTVVATLGFVLFNGERVRASLLMIPLLWCAISGATLWTMHAPHALVLPITGLTLLCLLWVLRR